MSPTSYQTALPRAVYVGKRTGKVNDKDKIHFLGGYYLNANAQYPHALALHPGKARRATQLSACRLATAQHLSFNGPKFSQTKDDDERAAADLAIVIETLRSSC